MINSRETFTTGLIQDKHFWQSIIEYGERFLIKSIYWVLLIAYECKDHACFLIY